MLFVDGMYLGVIELGEVTLLADELLVAGNALPHLLIDGELIVRHQKLHNDAAAVQNPHYLVLQIITVLYPLDVRLQFAQDVFVIFIHLPLFQHLSRFWNTQPFEKMLCGLETVNLSSRVLDY